MGFLRQEEVGDFPSTSSFFVYPKPLFFPFSTYRTFGTPVQKRSLAENAEFAEKVLFIRIPERGNSDKGFYDSRKPADFAIAAHGYDRLKANPQNSAGQASGKYNV